MNLWTRWLGCFACLVLPAAAVQAADIRTYDVPHGARPHDVAPDPAPGGPVWYTAQGQGALGRLDPATGKVKVWKSPRGSGPYGIATTSKGEVCYASLAGNHIAHVELATGEATVIEPPTPRQGARRVWGDSDGRVWVSEWMSGQVSVYDPAQKSWRAWKLPGASPRAYSVWVDEADKVWLTDLSANAIVRFDPQGERFDSFPSNAPDAAVRQMLGRRGEAWGAESGADRLVVVRH